MIKLPFKNHKKKNTSFSKKKKSFNFLSEIIFEFLNILYFFVA